MGVINLPTSSYTRRDGISSKELAVKIIKTRQSEWVKELVDNLSYPEYAKTTFPLLMKQLRECETKKLHLYTEKSLIAITALNKSQFLSLLKERYPELEEYSQKKRIEKIVRKINKRFF